jgi:hypothetical protein
MLDTKSVFIILGIVAVLIGMATGYTPHRALCDLGAPWCASTRI